MTRMIFTAAALALATPAIADQPMTLLEVRQHFAADDSGNEAVIYTGGSGITQRSAEIHAGIAARSNTGNTALDPTAADLLEGNGGVVNARAAFIFNQLGREDGAGAVN